MEVLSVLLAESSCRTVCCDVDPGVAEARIRVDLGEDHEAMPFLLARDNRTRRGTSGRSTISHDHGSLGFADLLAGARRKATLQYRLQWSNARLRL